MATISGETSKQSFISVSEQMKLVTYVKSLIKSSGLFSQPEIEINFLETNKDSLCLRLTNNSRKSREYIDGSYEGEVEFMFIVRKLNIANNYERQEEIDKINQLGELLENKEDFELIESGLEINYIRQTLNAGLIYRDDSGIEDNAATFIINYERNY